MKSIKTWVENVLRAAMRIWSEKRELCLLILMLIALPLAGLPALHPFAGDLEPFRISLGTPVFLAFLIMIKRPSGYVLGLVAGAWLVFCRGLGTFCWQEISCAQAFEQHIPTFFYYAIFSATFTQRAKQFPSAIKRVLSVLGWAMVAEILASSMEIFIRLYFLNADVIVTLQMLGPLLGISGLRILMMAAIFFLIEIARGEGRLTAIQKENEHLTLLVSQLYAESFQLDFAQKSAEQITKAAYYLYKEQKAAGEKGAARLLELAEQMHDVKKVNQRINAGLQALIARDKASEYLEPVKILNILQRSQAGYARSLGKNVEISIESDPSLPPLHLHIMLSLGNNLASNAIEAIKTVGTLHLSFRRQQEQLVMLVQNTGSSISEKRLPLIFTPGYTTKSLANGQLSTGIGLNYVQQLAEKLGGSVEVWSDNNNEVRCRIYLPLAVVTDNENRYKNREQTGGKL